MLHYDRGQFSSQTALVQALSRDRSKDMTLDYVDTFAARRNLPAQPFELERPGAALAARQSSVDPESIDPTDPRVVRALERFTATMIDIQSARREGRAPSGSQLRGFDRAERAFADLWPGAAGDLARTLKQTPGLLGQIALGRADLAAAALHSQRVGAKAAQARATTRPDLSRPRLDRAR